jgi:hypothetical protein
MALTDEQLLDFDMKRLGGLERAPRSILEGTATPTAISSSPPGSSLTGLFRRGY